VERGTDDRSVVIVVKDLVIMSVEDKVSVNERVVKTKSVI